MMRWAVVNLDRNPALLSAASYENLFRRHIDTSSPGVAMGLGWQLEQRDKRWLLRHAGGDRGFRALLTLYPDQHRAIVILSNGESTPRLQIRDAIETILAGRTPILPEPPLWLRYRFLLLLLALAFVALVFGGIVLVKRGSTKPHRG